MADNGTVITGPCETCSLCMIRKPDGAVQVFRVAECVSTETSPKPAKPSKRPAENGLPAPQPKRAAPEPSPRKGFSAKARIDGVLGAALSAHPTSVKLLICMNGEVAEVHLAHDDKRVYAMNDEKAPIDFRGWAADACNVDETWAMKHVVHLLKNEKLFIKLKDNPDLQQLDPPQKDSIPPQQSDE